MTGDLGRPWTIGNVRLFDGERQYDNAVVTIEGRTVIGVDTGAGSPGTVDVDGRGGLLMPGLIDAHVHATAPGDVQQLAAHGITTALDMASHSVSGLRRLRDAAASTDLRTAGPPASAAGGVHTRLMGFPLDSVVSGPGDAERFVAARAAEGSDYVKIIVEPPRAPAALDADTVAALVRCSRQHELLSVAHTAAHSAVELAVGASVDIVTHTPLDRGLDAAVVARMADQGTVCVPTLTMMRAVSQLPSASPAYRPGMDLTHAIQSVTALRAAGVRLLAGTDANTAPGTIVNVSPGRSLHDELALLVDAGLSALEALISATSLTADIFGLNDRGRVALGRRADLMLLSGNPLTTIADSRSIVDVWIGGVHLPRQPSI
jgi:imidazolonepropionase-like amidohydrolase